MSKEPRPVYAAELDVLGFDRYWNYNKQNDTPYMWAEANRYWYRGRLVASLKGGNVYNAPKIQLAFVCREYRETEKGTVTTIKTVFESPDKDEAFAEVKRPWNTFLLDEPEPNRGLLRPIDISAMVEANREILGWIADTTAKKILAIYEKYDDKLDIFHVAFSGGKDSCVLLDLVKKTLPKKSFVVVFGDTKMEFPDTYDVIDQTEAMCKREEIPFYRAYSHLHPKESWDLFGPPSRVLRWCCSVHKSTPQTLKLREVTGNENYTGLAYVGVRAEESVARAEYEYESYGKKQKGQFSHNSILEWTSAEVWLYIYANSVILNEAYKKGSQRVGCICCPMAGGKSGYLEFRNYSNVVNCYFAQIAKSNGRKNITAENYISEGGWNARKNGRYLPTNTAHYNETSKGGYLVITVERPQTDWKEWIKTLGELSSVGNKYNIKFQKEIYIFAFQKKDKGYIIKIDDKFLKDNPLFGKLFRYVFRKAAYCLTCVTCQASCKYGHITFDGGLTVKGCIHCHDCGHCKKYEKCKKPKLQTCDAFEHNGVQDCHSINAGCLAYDSLKIPQGENEKMKTINCFSNHAPYTDWLSAFFMLKDAFIVDNNLGPVQKTKFKRFLKDAELIENDKFTDFAELGATVGWNTDTFLGLMLVNLVAYNPQFEWYTLNLDVGRSRSRDEVVDMLVGIGQSKDSVSSIISAYKRLTETPFGTVLNWGYVSDDGSLARTKCSVSNPCVILYALYIYNKKANTHYEFRLNSLYENVEQDGVPPTQIFGLTREEMIPLLLGLSTEHSDFINASFTNDLDKISLKEDKTADDVLALFKEDI
jgi:phosphoadenosine phosphosulfate reductase